MTAPVIFKGVVTKTCIHLTAAPLIFIASVALAQEAGHRSSLLLSDIQPHLFQSPDHDSSATGPDSGIGGRISYWGSMFDIVQDRTKDQAGTVSSVSSDAASAGASVTLWQEPWRLHAWWRYAGMALKWSDRTDDLRANAQSMLNEGGIGIRNKTGRLRTSMTVGVAPGNADGNAKPSISRVLGESCSLLWNFNSSSIGLFAERRPVLASLARIETESNGAGRAFPLYVIRTRAGVPLSLTCKSITAGITPGFSKLISDTTARPPEKLNTVLDASGPFVRLWANSRPAAIPVSVECLLQKWSLGATGYDGTTMYTTLDNGEIIDGWAECAALFPHHLRAGCFGELADGNIPQGYFEAFPFTSWTLFDPVHYKITRLSAVYHEAGLFAEGCLRLGQASEIDGGADGSFLYGKFVFATRERKIEILIPYYTDESVLSNETKLMMIKLRCGYTLTLQKYSFRIWVRQLIPWMLPQHKNLRETTSPSQPSPATISRSTYGGLRVYVSGTINF
jgi:hypothetical protein